MYNYLRGAEDFLYEPVSTEIVRASSEGSGGAMWMSLLVRTFSARLCDKKQGLSI